MKSFCRMGKRQISTRLTIWRQRTPDERSRLSIPTISPEPGMTKALCQGGMSLCSSPAPKTQNHRTGKRGLRKVRLAWPFGSLQGPSVICSGWIIPLWRSGRILTQQPRAAALFNPPGCFQSYSMRMFSGQNLRGFPSIGSSLENRETFITATIFQVAMTLLEFIPWW